MRKLGVYRTYGHVPTDVYVVHPQQIPEGSPVGLLGCSNDFPLELPRVWAYHSYILQRLAPQGIPPLHSRGADVGMFVHHVGGAVKCCLSH
jgi:hypothetical protein